LKAYSGKGIAQEKAISVYIHSVKSIFLLQ